MCFLHLSTWLFSQQTTVIFLPWRDFHFSFFSVRKHSSFRVSGIIASKWQGGNEYENDQMLHMAVVKKDRIKMQLIFLIILFIKSLVQEMHLFIISYSNLQLIITCNNNLYSESDNYPGHTFRRYCIQILTVISMHRVHIAHVFVRLQCSVRLCQPVDLS